MVAIVKVSAKQSLHDQKLALAFELDVVVRLIGMPVMTSCYVVCR